MGAVSAWKAEQGTREHPGPDQSSEGHMESVEECGVGQCRTGAHQDLRPEEDQGRDNATADTPPPDPDHKQ